MSRNWVVKSSEVKKLLIRLKSMNSKVGAEKNALEKSGLGKPPWVHHQFRRVMPWIEFGLSMKAIVQSTSDVFY